ncbi:hypothetical protein H1R20_g6237, partial [Candolleomyces eurysporus]
MKYIPIQLSWALLLKWCATHAKDDALNGSGGGCAACGRLANARRPGDSGDDSEDSDKPDFELKEELQALFEGPLKSPEQASAKADGSERLDLFGIKFKDTFSQRELLRKRQVMSPYTTENFPEIIQNIGIVI